MRKAGLLGCCLAFITVVIAQDSTSPSSKRFVGGTFSYHPYDFFLSAQYAVKKNRLEYSFRFGTAINRTIFQQRFFPRSSAQLSFHAVNKDLLQVGLMLRTDFSMLNVNRSSSHGMHYFEELTPGVFVAVGKRYSYRLTAGLGPLWEQAWSTEKSGFKTWLSWNSLLELSVSYAL